MIKQDRIIREAECKKITGLSRTTRWRMSRAGDFPMTVRVGQNAVGWRLSDIEDWLDSLEYGGPEQKVTPKNAKD